MADEVKKDVNQDKDEDYESKAEKEYAEAAKAEAKPEIDDFVNDKMSTDEDEPNEYDLDAHDRKKPDPDPKPDPEEQKPPEGQQDTKPEAEKKPSEEQPGGGKPGEGDGQKPDDPLAKIAKLEEQVQNINKANRETRDENKRLRDEIAELKKPAPPKQETDNETDPEVRETIRREFKAITEEERKRAEEEAVKAGEQKWESSAKDFEDGLTKKAKDGGMSDEDAAVHGSREFKRIVQGYFEPMLKTDKELADRFFSSDDPGKFAYEEGTKIFEAEQEKLRTSMKDDIRSELVKELNDKGLNVSLSSLAGTSPAGVKPPKQEREWDGL